MKKTACMDHDHVLKENQVSMARELGRMKFCNEKHYRAERSVWAWVVVWEDGMVCHGYGGEPSHGEKQYMQGSFM